jgi:PAS domain S-box-containing protein
LQRREGRRDSKPCGDAGTIASSGWKCTPGPFSTKTENSNPSKASSRTLRSGKKAEKELFRLATAIEQAAEGVLISDTDWTILYVNPALEKISGYSKKEMIGARTDLLKSRKHDRRFYGEIKGTLKRGEVWSGRLVNQRKDGTEYEAEVTASPVRDESGEIINFVAVHRDITHEAKLQRHLREAQKMEAIGTLAGGIAHDFNNILTAIMCYTEMAMAESAGIGRLSHRLNRVLMGCQRAKELVEQIITFSRQREREQKPVLINSIIKETLKLLSSSFPKTIEIDTNIERCSSVINADPSQVHQVLLNLCTNAAYAMRETGGVLEVTLQKIDLDETSTRSRIDLKPGPYVKLVVSDTGHGMDESVKERIFEPFFTTKPKEEGSGMGLSVVHGIVKGLGGAISVYSELGLGTTFNVYFPRIETETEDQAKAPVIIPTGTERILYVDDERMLVEITNETLESLGYQVTATTDSMEALELFRTNPEKFDLVITDMTMPKITGETLARECLRIRPDIPVILCTGFSELITEEKAREAGIRGYIMKPLLVGDLAKAIRKVLDSPDLSCGQR